MMTHGFLPKKTSPTPLIAKSNYTSLKVFTQIIDRQTWMGSRRCLIVLLKKPTDEDGGLLKELCFYFVGTLWGCETFLFCLSVF